MFYNQTTYANLNSAYSVAVVDVNSDSQPDIVVVDQGSNNVGVLFNAGNGTFLSPNFYPTANTPYAVVAVDVNSDNKPDIVVANSVSNNVGVLFNAGNGTFINETAYTTGSAPRALAVVDVNNDSKPDIIVANSGTNTVSVFFNVGNGTFLTQVTYSIGTGGPAPNAIAVADVNSDNKPDIVVANQGASGVGVLFNAGNGTFLSVTAYSSGTFSAPRGVAVVDVNGDNKPDIITANTGLSTVGVFINAGNGTFRNVATYSSGAASAARGVAVVDVNGDNKPDIITANTGSSNTGVLINAGNGTFLPVTTYSTGNSSTPRAVAVVDVNSDNKPDIIVANSGSNNTGVLLHC